MEAAKNVRQIREDLGREGKLLHAVDHDAESECPSVESEPGLERGSLDPLACHHGKEKCRHPERADESQVNLSRAHGHSHAEGDRHGGHDREEAPGAFGESLDHDKAPHRQEDHHDGDDPDQRDEPGKGADLLGDHLPEALASPA